MTPIYFRKTMIILISDRQGINYIQVFKDLQGGYSNGFYYNHFLGL